MRKILENYAFVYVVQIISLEQDGHKTYSRYFMRAKIPATYRGGLFLQLSAESAKFSVRIVFCFVSSTLTQRLSS